MNGLVEDSQGLLHLYIVLIDYHKLEFYLGSCSVKKYEF